MATFPVMENWHSFTEFNGAKPIYTCRGPSYCMRWIVHSFRMRELFDHALWSEWATLKARRWQTFKSILTQVKLNLVHNIFPLNLQDEVPVLTLIGACLHTQFSERGLKYFMSRPIIEYIFKTNKQTNNYLFSILCGI